MNNPLKSEMKLALPTDYELLVMISWKNEPEMRLAAENAFDEFYKKHRRYLMKATRMACNRYTQTYGIEMIDVVFNNTFMAVYEKTEVILNKFEEYKNADYDIFRQNLLAYIGKIANNCLNAYLRQARPYYDQLIYCEENCVPELFDFFDTTEETDDEIPILNEKAQILNAGLKLLPERERDILITTFRYQEDGKNLPKEVINELCQRWNILPDYLRLLKKRAFDKVKNYALAHSNP